MCTSGELSMHMKSDTRISENLHPLKMLKFDLQVKNRPVINLKNGCGVWL